jgi:hypothetical protein
MKKDLTITISISEEEIEKLREVLIKEVVISGKDIKQVLENHKLKVSTTR